jgi:glycosyltransferase involved in cell wall biosynthesis
VAFLLPTLDRIGGAERLTLQLARGLLDRRWRISMVTLSGDGGSQVREAQELKAAGVAFYSLRMRHGLADPGGWLRWRRWLREAAPEIVHAHLPHAALLARWSRPCAPVRVLVDTLHSSATGPVLRRLGYRLSRLLPDCVTAVSEAAARTHLSAAMVDPARLVVLPNGVDLAHWKPDPAARAALRRAEGLEGEFLWLAAGRLDPVKDYPTLLGAMAALPASAVLRIAGAGPLEGDLRRLVQALGLAERVRFLGFVEDLRPWMQAADALALSSLWEGLPLTVLEASACGLPVAATDVPGTREAVDAGETGFLSPAGDARALAQSMRRILELSPADRQAMGERSRARTSRLFALESMLDRWEELYRELLDRNPLPRRRGQRPSR